MVPASITITSTLAGASTVVSELGGVVSLVAAMSIGVFVVGWLISKLRNSTY